MAERLRLTHMARNRYISRPLWRFMNRQPHMAVVGATGAVGVEMVASLEKRNFPSGQTDVARLGDRPVGKEGLKFKGQDITITELTKDSFIRKLTSRCSARVAAFPEIRFPLQQKPVA